MRAARAGYPHFKGLMVAVPHTGRPIPPQWAWGFTNLHPPMNFNTNYANVMGWDIDKARQHFAEEAVRMGHEYLFFLGEDNVPPAFAIRQLIYDLENFPEISVVGGIYCHKAKPHNPMVFRGNGKGCYWNWKVGELFEVTGLGMDCTMIRVKDLAKLEKPWFKTIDTIDPTLEGVPSGTSWTEDLYFCNKATEAGLKIYADAGVLCDHINMQTGESTKLPEESLPTRRYVFPPKLLKAVDLGCGADPIKIEGAHVLKVDIREDVGPDFRCDVGNLPFAAGEFDIVYSSHVLEHFSRDRVPKVLDEWLRLLKPNGEFRLIVPNLEWAAKKLLAGETDDMVYNVFYGAQTYNENFHKFGFTPSLITQLLKERGFTRIDIQLLDYHLQLRAWRVPPKSVPEVKGVPMAHQPAAVPGDPAKHKAGKFKVNLTVAVQPAKKRKSRPK